MLIIYILICFSILYIFHTGSIPTKHGLNILRDAIIHGLKGHIRTHVLQTNVKTIKRIPSHQLWPPVRHIKTFSILFTVTKDSPFSFPIHKCCSWLVQTFHLFRSCHTLGSRRTIVVSIAWQMSSSLYTVSYTCISLEFVLLR